jgi:hypothetical protein
VFKASGAIGQWLRKVGGLTDVGDPAHVSNIECNSEVTINGI